MKLSKRLKKIDGLVETGYDHIWDCCCDHGYLGAHLLSRGAGRHIHFVDIVPKLMSEVESNLQRFFVNSDTPWSVHCIDVATIPLNQHKGRHLIIIAGVGGDLMINLMQSILERNPDRSFDFLLCPVYHQYQVRRYLNAQGFLLNEEVLMEENSRYYEILFVSLDANNGRMGQPVSLTGIDIWKPKNKDAFSTAKAYLDKTIAHYQRIAKGNSAEYQSIVTAYKNIEIKRISKASNVA
ncbi:tRNA (adenine(22)-N(1))-methyltransferase TrmK [Vibrio sp. 10N.261.55.A7]|uniref:tRNA (adenine(22)-N(1))-methyltransferase n=1 Tax=Vibrio sp. 10N.261.55.A7 TaxID=1880851 RepID=UPI000CC4F27D|nr:tRNA (adenine(22)-N(1))-methyltransferase TrmK [Vibrio sp. 10N.261.55.A7]PMJ93151.1 hypothetical protein BCU12_05965 [Vibrio sp. 10N.261.55.A7]